MPMYVCWSMWARVCTTVWVVALRLGCNKEATQKQCIKNHHFDKLVQVCARAERLIDAIVTDSYFAFDVCVLFFIFVQSLAQILQTEKTAAQKRYFASLATSHSLTRSQEKRHKNNVDRLRWVQSLTGGKRHGRIHISHPHLRSFCKSYVHRESCSNRSRFQNKQDSRTHPEQAAESNAVVVV